MPFKDLLTLRPGIDKERLFEIATREAIDEYTRIVEVGFNWGPPADSNLEGIDKRNILEAISFSFEADKLKPVHLPLIQKISVYGFNLGMSLLEAQKSFEKFQFAIYHHVKKYRGFLGKTQDSFEIKLNFFRQEDGTEILYYINIAQADHTKICEVRKIRNRAKFEIQKESMRRAGRWKKIENNDDEVLMDWARHCKPWNDYSESQFIKYASWLMNTSPTERHFSALHWNWDYGEAPQIWIARQSDTDIATAITIFFGCDPFYYLQYTGKFDNVVAEDQRFILENILDIKTKIETGFYKNSNIHLNLESEFEILSRYDRDISKLEHTIPVNLKKNYSGIEIDYASLNIPDFGIA